MGGGDGRLQAPAGDRPAPASQPQVATELASRLTENLGQAVRGKPEAIHLAVVALMSGGHLLVEDVPGMGKTLLAKALARSLGGTFARIQATPDLLPTELTGTNVFRPGDGRWEFRPGPLFANVVLVDEVNRATPRTQGAARGHGGGPGHRRRREPPAARPVLRRRHPDPFEHTGTFPLLEGQRDRFAIVVHLGPPDREAERELLLGTGGHSGLERLAPVPRRPA